MFVLKTSHGLSVPYSYRSHVAWTETRLDDRSSFAVVERSVDDARVCSLGQSICLRHVFETAACGKLIELHVRFTVRLHVMQLTVLRRPFCPSVREMK